MELLSLLDDSVTNVPLQFSDPCFRKAIHFKLHAFKDKVNKAQLISSKGFLGRGELEDCKSKIGSLIEGLLKCIDQFYEGRPAKAYLTFSNTMKELEITSYLDKNCRYQQGSSLFRIRTTSGNYPLSKDGLFHIPFEKRGMVKSQRFSIPGLPSLYTSNSIYVAWEEMRRPNIDSIQAIRLENQRDLKLLDITNDVYVCNIDNLDLRIDANTCLYKILTWPLAACCSIKVRNTEDSFKPEYIIPQLLFQWVSENLDGIKYSSSHIDLNKVKHRGQFHNIVLPVKTYDQDNGYCGHLKSLFKGTDVIPMQLRQFATSNDRFSHQPSISSDINDNVTELALIEGTTQYYSQTLFGVLEHGLRGLQVKKL
jgi:hypothetical protein